MFETVTDADCGAPARNVAQKLFHQARLPDARLAGKQDYTAIAMGIPPHLRKTRELICASDERTPHVPINRHAVLCSRPC